MLCPRLFSRSLPVLIGALVWAVPAQAMGWAAPVALAPEEPGYRGYPYGVDLGFDGDGRALAMWVTRIEQGAPPTVLRLAARPPGGSWMSLPAPALAQPPRETHVAEAAMAVDRAGSAVLLTLPWHAGALVRSGTADGRFGAPVVVADDRFTTGAQVEVGPSGDVLATWRGRRRDARAAEPLMVRAAVRRRGRGFGPAQSLSGPGASNHVAALGPRGDMVVAWTTFNRRVRARFAAAGRGFGPVHTLGRHVGSGGPPGVAAAISPRGRALVAWAGQDVDDGGGFRRYEVQAATGGPGGFDRARTLDGGRGHAGREAAAIFDSRSRGLVAWSGVRRGSHFVGVRRLDRRGRLGEPQRLRGGRVLGGIDLTAGPAGRALVTWWSLGARDIEADRLGQPRAALRPTGRARFGPIEHLGAGDMQPEVTAAAFDPAGIPTVLLVRLGVEDGGYTLVASRRE